MKCKVNIYNVTYSINWLKHTKWLLRCENAERILQNTHTHIDEHDQHTLANLHETHVAFQIARKLRHNKIIVNKLPIGLYEGNKGKTRNQVTFDREKEEGKQGKHTANNKRWG